MGYYTTVSGEIRIEPPIPWAEIRSSQFVPGGEFEAVLVVEETSEDTPEGTLVRKQAVAITPCSEDGFKAYHLVEHVQAIIWQGDGGPTGDHMAGAIRRPAASRFLSRGDASHDDSTCRLLRDAGR